MLETETESYMAFVCVCVRWTRMYAYVHASPWLYDFIPLFSFDSKLTRSLVYGDCSDV
jgi:hypothetical protein